MKDFKQIIIVLVVLFFLLLGGVWYSVFDAVTLTRREPAMLISTSTVAATNTEILINQIPEALITGIVPPPLDDNKTLLAAGNGTTTQNNATPFNDLLIVGTDSPYATLRNARYIQQPYPSTSAFKEIYLLLPDAYTPIFSGYSDRQLIVSSDGSTQVPVVLRHRGNLGTGGDVHITIQSPVETDEAPHAITKIDSSAGGAVFSLVQDGKEVIVEVVYAPAPNVPTDMLQTSRAQLIEEIGRMEIRW